MLPKYNQYFRNQLRESLTPYGLIDEVWFDGPCGEGPDGKKQEYDWPNCYALIRAVQRFSTMTMSPRSMTGFSSNSIPPTRAWKPSLAGSGTVIS